MHAPMAEPQRWYARILRGRYAYYGLPNNPARCARSIRRSDASGSAVSGSAVRRLGTSPGTASLQCSSAFLYRCLGSLTLGRLGRHEAGYLREEPGAGCVRRSWYELASASLVRPKPSKQDGSESYGRHGNVGSGAWTAVGRGVGLTPEIGLLRRPSWRPHQRRQHTRSRYARGRMHRRGLRPGHVRTAHAGT